jgi:hypothetical protein
VGRERVRDIEMELEWWQEKAATFLYSEESILCNLLTVIQSRALKLALANAEILLYRTYLLDDAEYCTASNSCVPSVSEWEEEVAIKVKKCLGAALRVTEMIDVFSTNVKSFKASWVWNAGLDKILSQLTRSSSPISVATVPSLSSTSSSSSSPQKQI